MAHLFAEAKFKFGIAHCNFKLRGEHADGDEQFVEELAGKLHVPFHSIHFETSVYAKQQGISIEMAARTLRYKWFEQIRSINSYSYVALAHHQNDSVETVLLNLIRGTGIAGLHGILPKREALIRPLLFLNREEIEVAVNDKNLVYRDDETNFSPTYLRNKIRIEVIPRLKEINPSLEKTFIENSHRFEELEELLHTYSDGLRRKLFHQQPDGGYRVAIKALQELRPLKTLIYELFSPYHFTSDVLDDLLVAWHKENRTGKMFYSETHSLLINRNELILKTRYIDEEQQQELVPGKPINFHHYNILVRLCDEIDKMHAEGMVAVDADRIVFPLVVRTWQEGDWFKPLGMTGKKKVSDFFISLKIPLSEKKRIPVVVNGNGDILWIVPYRIDNRYKITDKTKKVAILECR